MRFLHTGHDPLRRRPPPHEPASDRRGRRGFHGGQRLPVRDVSADRLGGPPRFNRGGEPRSRSVRCGKGAEAVTPVTPGSTLEDDELSQHEIGGERLHWFELARRDFVKVLGGGLLVCLAAPRALRSQESGAAARPGGRERDLPSDLAAWIHVGGDGVVTVFTGKVEMGQNIRTSLSQHVAEELHVPVASIRMVMGDTDRRPYDMGTFGSRTTPTMGLELRRAAATAREALLDLAAKSWKADRGSLEARDGKVFPATARRSPPATASSRAVRTSSRPSGPTCPSPLPRTGRSPDSRRRRWTAAISSRASTSIRRTSLRRASITGRSFGRPDFVRLSSRSTARRRRRSRERGSFATETSWASPRPTPGRRNAPSPP